jgi:uncharacterized membrane protein
MNSAYYHLLINELPLIGVIIAIVVLIIGLLTKHNSVKRTSLGLFMLSGILTIPSYFTGKRTQLLLNGSEGIDPEFVRLHAQAGEEFIRMIAILAVIALVTFVVDIKGHRKTSSLLYIATLAAAIFMFFMVQHVGTTGREIRHPEIRIEKSKE